MAPSTTAADATDGPETDAMHQPAGPAAELALPLLLQHDSARTRLRLVCSLLCCSKAVAAVVAEHCAGQLDIPRSASQPGTAPQQANPVSAWLSKHARLARSLDLRLPPCSRDGSSIRACAAALVAAQPQTLALQSLGAMLTSDTLPLLEQLPAGCLTRLSVLVADAFQVEAVRPAFLARASAALARLTATCALELRREAPDYWLCQQHDLSGLSALTELTALSFCGPLPDLQHAPPAQLLELCIAEVDASSQQQQQQRPTQPLELSRLTALTALTAVRLQAADDLPPGLLRMVALECRCVRPLLALRRLQQLHLALPGDPENDTGVSDIPADQLQQLSGSITTLGMTWLPALGDYGHWEGIEPASAAAWPLLPLQRLELKGIALPARVCQSLAQLSGLTALQLELFELPAADSAQQLAVVLRRLSGLQQLVLSDGCQAESTPADARAAAADEGMQQLAQAVCGLPRLRELSIARFHRMAAAVTASAASARFSACLTALSMARNDVAVAAVVAKLSGLVRLDCSGNVRGMTMAALRAIGQLRNLTELSLCSTFVRDAHLSHLHGLRRLVRLDVSHTGASFNALCQLPQLTCLHAPARVTAEQRRLLRQRLPDLLELH